MQVRNLCDPERIKLEEDAYKELTKLPLTLAETYEVSICSRLQRPMTVPIFKTKRLLSGRALVSPRKVYKFFSFASWYLTFMDCGLLFTDI